MRTRYVTSCITIYIKESFKIGQTNTEYQYYALEYFLDLVIIVKNNKNMENPTNIHI